MALASFVVHQCLIECKTFGANVLTFGFEVFHSLLAWFQIILNHADDQAF